MISVSVKPDVNKPIPGSHVIIAEIISLSVKPDVNKPIPGTVMS